MRGAEVRKSARLRESVFVNEACIIKNSLVAVRVIRRTKLFISGARIAAGDTVAATKPGPPDGITDRDIYCGRCKRETTLRYRHIEDLPSAGWDTAYCRLAVLIHNVDGVAGGLVQL